jgi:2-polyprenyl-6-methoxyphenol hydroxylase-like FAD-dependent oxidoreductase
VETISTTCVIAGGGPAGMMCGYLLARAGVDVTVLEKHADFLRDFRGDTVHPSTLQVMHELGLLSDFLKLPHTRIRTANLEIGDEHFLIGDFSRLPTVCKFIALMPQWDFLDFLVKEASKLPNFHLLMQTEARDLIAQGDRIAGVLATGRRSVGPSQSDQEKVNLQIRAGLTIAADGRHSLLRDKSGLKVEDLGAPFDVLWLRLPVLPGDPADLIGKVKGGQLLVLIYRADYWQCAYLIPKGGFDVIKAEGLSKFRARLKQIAGFASGRVDDAIKDFDQVKLLTVTVDRLSKWARPGLVCIGDAAHAMSPIGGVGINLAIQDAVAAANILGPVLRKGVPSLRDLKKVQKRREFPTRVIQAFQVAAQNIILAPTLAAMQTPKPPLFVKILNAWPWARQFPARFIGMGVRPEHVRLRVDNPGR